MALFQGFFGLNFSGHLRCPFATSGDTGLGLESVYSPASLAVSPPTPMSAAKPEAQSTVDAVLHPRWIVPMSGAQHVLAGHSIALSGSRIAAIAPTAEINARFKGRSEFRLDTHVVMPGLINAHGHAPMTLLRGYADDMPLQPWLEEVIWPAEARVLSESFVADGARLAIAEMLLGGTTCFTDMYFFPDQVAQAATDAGMRAQLACPVFDFPTAWARDADDYITKAHRLHDQYRNSELIDIAFGPHAPYTVSDAPLRKVAYLADELDVSIHIHLHENAQEISDALRSTGKRPLARLNELGLLSPRLQCVHMTQVEDAELALLAANGVHVVHCPSSNLKLASGFCRTQALLDAGVNVALGTDGSASNNRLDMFGELRLAALLAKGASNDARAVPAFAALEMATLGGARALGIDELTGSLEAGKLADLIAMDLAHPNTQPVFDPVSTLAYSAHSSQVTHVWVHGALLVADSALTRMDLQQVMADAARWGEQISRGAK
jgi:5-methylthioadenosine/S-adenosylhomocysteine deaminase